MGSISFTTTLVPRGPAAAIVLDDDQVAAVGEGARRFPVVATVNGHTWRSTVVRMGGEFLLGLSRENRQGAGAETGDEVSVDLALDSAPREVEVPAPLADALAGDADARAAFDKLSISLDGFVAGRVLGGARPVLEPVEVVASPAVTHIRYRAGG